MPESISTEEVWLAEPLPEDMQIAQPHKSGAKNKPAKIEYYPYEQQLTFRYGRSGSIPDMKLNDNLTGFQYLFPKFLSPKLEAGADLHEGGTGHVHAGVRWIARERSYFRPSVKLGGDLNMKADEGLATFSSLDNYYVRATGTLEYVIWNPFSIRFENELLLGTKERFLETTLALSRGW